jgi:nitroimidazol reductase NimA-like FMN-containing flavoprotein (pyridoxamine 5'-phosphate oxidase superfamily)
MSRRDQIRMTPEEVSNFLKEAKTIILVSNGKDGFPHPMPMWYAVDDDNVVYMTTFRKSQKINNLRQDPKVALLVEAGDVYQELKSILIYTEVELIEDVEGTRDILFKISVARGDLSEDAGASVREGMLKTAEKRIGMKFSPDKIVSWDHSKLGGTY